MELKIYYVKNCMINTNSSFTGFVFNIDNEDLLVSIKRKLNMENQKFLCEAGFQFEYDEMNLNNVTIGELSVAEYMLIVKYMFSKLA